MKKEKKKYTEKCCVSHKVKDKFEILKDFSLCEVYPGINDKG